MIKTTTLVPLAHAPVRLPRLRKRRVPQKISCGLDMSELSYHVGKGLTLWVMFTSGLNWLYYRNIRKKNDKK